MNDRNNRRQGPRTETPKRPAAAPRQESEIIRTRRRIGTTGASIGDRDSRVDSAGIDPRIRS
jgi:hypothetical protein